MPLRSPPPAVGVCPTERTAGVDYFRYRVAALRDVRTVRDHVRHIQEEDVAKGSKRAKWRFNGYEGFQTERIRYGERSGRLIWETSGKSAPHTWTLVPLVGGTAMRVDVQTTLRLSHSLVEFGKRFLPPEATSLPYTLPNGMEVTQRRGARGLWFTSVAARTGDRHFRLYDKGAEQKDDPPGKKWRIELEAKYRLAEGLCREAVERLKDPEWCDSYVESQWRSVGCYWPIPSIAGYDVAVRLPPKRMPGVSDLAIWVNRSVRPTIPRLLKCYTVGEVLTMLGLEEVASPRRSANEDVANGAHD